MQFGFIMIEEEFCYTVFEIRLIDKNALFTWVKVVIPQEEINTLTAMHFSCHKII